MTKRLPCPLAPGPLEDYPEALMISSPPSPKEEASGSICRVAAAQGPQQGASALAGMEPIVGAQGAPAQKLQFFLSESAWEAEEVNARRVRMLREDSSMAPHEQGVLVIDETGDRKDGKATDHVGYQYLGSIGRIANGIVSVSSVWADGRIYYPLGVEPYTRPSDLRREEAIRL